MVGQGNRIWWDREIEWLRLSWSKILMVLLMICFQVFDEHLRCFSLSASYAAVFPIPKSQGERRPISLLVFSPDSQHHSPWCGVLRVLGMVKDCFSRAGRMLQDSPRYHQLILQQIQSTETVWFSVLWCKDTEVPKLRPMTFEGSKRVKPGGLVWKNASKTPKLPSSAWSKTILLVQGCFGASSHVKRGNLPSSCSKVKAHRCSDGKTYAEDITRW